MTKQQNISVVTSEYTRDWETKWRRTNIGKLITKDDWKQFIALDDWVSNFLRLPLWKKFEWLLNVAPPKDQESDEENF